MNTERALRMVPMVALAMAVRWLTPARTAAGRSAPHAASAWRNAT